MTRVLKFDLGSGLNEVRLPGAAVGRPTVEFQDGQLRMWQPVNEAMKPEKLTLFVALTGEVIPPSPFPEFLGTAFKGENKSFIVHLFRL